MIMDMNRLKDGIREKVNTVKMLAVFCAGLLSIGMTACDDGLDVTQAYPFTVETMPVPKELAKGETAEIRCELVREGEFDGAVYTIRYFQFDGKGTLKLDNGWCSSLTTVTCWRTRSSACTTHRSVTSRRA